MAFVAPKINIPIIFCLLLLFITIFIFNPPSSGDNDIWWHLKYGEHFVQNWTWYIDHSAFSWTPSSPDWKYVTWIGSSLLYLVYISGDFAGLFLLHSLLLVLTLGLYLFYISLVKKRFDIPDIFCMLLVALSSNSNRIKPDSFTTLFFAMAVFIYFYSKTTSKSIFLLNVPLFLIWVNTHGGFVFGLFFISLALIMELLNFYFIKSAPLSQNLIRDFALGVFLSYAVLIINPYGPQYIISLAKDLFFSDYMEQSKNLLAYASIWKQLWPTSNLIGFTIEGWQLIVAMVIFMLACAYVYSKIKSIDPAVVTTNIAFFFAAMVTGRLAKFFPILWLFSIAFLIRPFEMNLPRRKLAAISFFLIILFTLAHIKNVLTLNNHNSWFDRSSTNSLIPAKEATFIKSHNLPGPIFNDYLTGGYMIWSMYPEYKVFIDPRYGPYSKEVLSDWFDFDNASADMNLDHLASKYRFNTVFLDLDRMSMIKRFISSPDWKLVYFDIKAAVLIRTEIFKSNEQTFHTVDLGPERFSHVDDPLVLMNIFTIYNSLASPREMAIIRNIYKKNVSDYYFLKEVLLDRMDFVFTNKFPMPK
jgi:hypothetical protein